MIPRVQGQASGAHRPRLESADVASLSARPVFGMVIQALMDKWHRRARFTALGRIAGWVGLVLIAVLFLVPGELRPHTGLQGPLEHFTAYVLATTPLMIGHWRRRPASMVALLVIYAGCLETTQLWIPGRVAAIVDFSASSLGAALGVSL